MIDGGRAASADNLGVLMPEHGILRLKPAGRLERRSQQFPTPDLFSTEAVRDVSPSQSCPSRHARSSEQCW
jgi:hypothetical protein